MSFDENNFLGPFNKKPFTDLFSIFDGWFEDPLGLFEQQIKVDMYETKENLVIEADIPGVKKEQIQLAWTRDGLQITVEDRRETAEANEIGKYYRKERSVVRKGRFLPLQLVATPRNIRAKYEEGLLQITIPTYNLKRNTRRIIDIE